MADKARDGWDKLDVIAKLLSGVFLGALSLAVGFGAREIAEAQKTGELVRSLIQDLTSEDKQTRQDLALIALDHAASRQDPELVAEIAERILLDFRARDSTAQLHDIENSVAYKVLTKRDKDRAAGVLAAATTQAGSQQRTAISLWDTTRIKEEIVSAEARLLPAIAGNVVYIQFKRPVSRPLMEQLRASLNAQGFNAPGTELITGNYGNWVRYFHEEDRALAEKLVDVVRQALGSAAPADFKAQGLVSQKFRVPRGQLEVWLAM